MYDLSDFAEIVAAQRVFFGYSLDEEAAKCKHVRRGDVTMVCVPLKDGTFAFGIAQRLNTESSNLRQAREVAFGRLLALLKGKYNTIQVTTNDEKLQILHINSVRQQNPKQVGVGYIPMVKAAILSDLIQARYYHAYVPLIDDKDNNYYLPRPEVANELMAIAKRVVAKA